MSRRRLLGTSAVLGTAVTAGCSGDESGGETNQGAEPITAPTVFVFNTGDGTVTLIDAASRDVIDTVELGLTASFPSNQFSPGLTTDAGDPLWLNVEQGVRALGVDSFAEAASVTTGSGANWQERTPGGDHLLVSAREPVHRQFRLDSDPAAETFGEVTGEIDRQSEGGRGEYDGPGPCDVTIHPDGAYAYVPDLYGDTLTVIDVEAFEIERQIDVASRGRPPEPWMATAAWDGKTILVEHNAGEKGSESIWDISDPAAPVERTRVTPADGLGEGALTSEIGPDSATGYVFTPGTEDVTVLDLDAGDVERRIDLGGKAYAGTWDPSREHLYVPIQSADEVAVIDHERREIRTRLDVGAAPYGATAAEVRPADPGEAASNAARLATLAGEYGTTYCIEDCACGHRL